MPRRSRKYLEEPRVQNSRLHELGYTRLPNGDIVKQPSPPPIFRGKPHVRKSTDTRLSPSTRKGARFRSVLLTEEAYLKICEIVRFTNGRSRLSVLSEMINKEFEEVYKQAELLARIEARRQREEEEINNAKAKLQEKAGTKSKVPSKAKSAADLQDRNNAPRRTHF